ncbi:hypothetical protein J2800_000797 [Caulobacter rhizosphaerae]|jgi:hypothetical protein|uniref:Transmembrane protein n=1 Tax=Caulobacter rhizosphaerae TaxID=2010972 RepID=A0ABU1MV53_9CAUL|nr:hypothetical protein [Caulobacter rhizosphaerae]MDR6530073.1 hypothetical protein [Caulobacter rhizosphaerae]
MATLSAILYFLAHHPFWSWPVLVLVGATLGRAMATWRRQPGWYALMAPFFFFGIANFFTGHIFNALFLNAFGETGAAVVTHSRETSSTLNDQPIWAYDAVLKTADGRDVVTGFTTMSASIYPITNEILIPPEGEMFVAKYIPGFPRNIAIMRDLSPYGKVYRIGMDRGPVDKAANQFAASPGNAAFIAEYRRALTVFLEKHRHDADPDLVRDFEARLEALPPAE